MKIKMDMDRYEEALERAKAGKPMDEVFPELKESEDERILQMLENTLRDALIHECVSEMSFVEMSSYLDRLKEQKDYRKRYEDIAKSEWFKKAYKGKSLGCDYEQKDQKPFSQEVFDAAKHEALWGEQKPAEIDEYKIIKKHITEDSLSSEVNKRLKECGWYVTYEKPAEWSQDDNDFADDAIACVTRCYEKYKDNKEFYQSLRHNTMDIKRWLIEVRKRLTPHWKPSEEQMAYLLRAIMILGDEGYGKTASILKEIRDNLEKLM